jgi:predicted nucleotidyltransferase
VLILQLIMTMHRNAHSGKETKRVMSVSSSLACEPPWRWRWLRDGLQRRSILVTFAGLLNNWDKMGGESRRLINVHAEPTTILANLSADPSLMEITRVL